MPPVANVPLKKPYDSDLVEMRCKFGIEISQMNLSFDKWTLRIAPPAYMAMGVYLSDGLNGNSIVSGLTQVFFMAVGTTIAYGFESRYAFDKHRRANEIKMFKQYIRGERANPGQQHIPINFEEVVKQNAKTQAAVDLRRDWKHWVYKGAIVTVGALACGYQLYQSLPQNTKDSFNKKVFGSAEIQQPITPITRSVQEAYGLLRLRSQ